VFPYPIIYANKAWTKITGYEQNEVFGKPLAFLQGPLTDSGIMDEVRSTPSQSQRMLDCRLLSNLDEFTFLHNPDNV
jgi:PAS domain-containing protein